MPFYDLRGADFREVFRSAQPGVERHGDGMSELQREPARTEERA